MPKTEVCTILSEQDGLALSVLAVIPDGEVRALVQLAHGMCEHKERYLPFMIYLANHGYMCAINDHRGHGASIRNKDDLGYFYKNGDRAMVEDLHQITLWLRAQAPGKPCFLFGHSMGSLAVRAYTEKYDMDIDALAVCGSPGANPAAGAGLALIALMQLFRGERYRSPMMQELITGSFAKRFPDEETRYAWLSENRESVKAYEHSRLCGFTFTLNGYRALLRLMRRVYRKRTECGNPGLPVYFCSGENDPCMPNRKGFDHAMECMKKAGYKNVTGRLFKGMRHEILNEVNAESVHEMIRREAFDPYV